MIKNVFFIAWILLSTINYAQKTESTYEELIVQSNRLAYNFKFDESRALTIKALNQKPNKPEAYNQLAQNYLWFYLGSKNENEFYKFISYSDTSIVRAEDLLDQNPKNIELLYLLGNIYKQRAMAYGEKQETLSAFWATKKAVGYFEDVLDIDKTFYSAYGNIGIFEYALSFVPSYLKWALSITGLSSNKEEGFKKIEKAYLQGKRDKTEIKFHAAKLFDEYLADYEKSSNILSSLLNEYPDNALFHYQYALEFIKNKELDEARKELDKVLEINNPKFAQTSSFANLLKADTYFFQNKFEKALNYYLEFLKTTKTIDYTGIASYRTAICYYFSGLDNNIELFKRYLILAANGNLDIEEDAFANEKSHILLKFGLTHPHAEIIKIENLCKSGEYKKVIKRVSENIDSFQDNELKALALIYLSGAYIEVNNLHKAQKILDDLLKIKVKREFWIKPMALFYKAKIKFKMKDYQRMDTPLKVAEDANEFSKQNLIQSYINGLRRKLKDLGY